MPPYVSIPDTTPHLEPLRLVLVPLQCFYCGHAVAEDICEWRIHHLFGLFHCPAHEGAAERDCKAFMRAQGVVRICDARQHAVLSAFMTALGATIPVLRSSGAVDMDWRFPFLDERPIIRRSNTTGSWGFNLDNSDCTMSRFIPLSQFRDLRVVPHLKEEVRNLLDSVENLLVQGFYAEM